MAMSAADVGLEHLQLKDRVYQYLRQAIINGDYEIGVALREIDISHALGVSKTPVREAFVRLQADRFVELIPYRGAVVAGYSRADIRQMYEVREIVEGYCAAKVAVSADEQLRDALRVNVAATRQAADAGDIRAVADLLEEFDALIYSCTDNDWISSIVRDLDGHQERVGRPTAVIPGRVDRSAEQHEKILAAILDGDPAGAESAMREHVRSVMTDKLRHFDESSA